MREKKPSPPKIILTLAPEIGADGQDGTTESAGPRLMIDAAVSGRQETGALVAGELALSSTHAHAEEHAVRLSFMGRAGPVFKGVLARVEEVLFAFPGWLRGGFPVCLVENCDGSFPASYGPVAGNLVDLLPLNGHGDVVCGDVEGGGFGGVPGSCCGRIVLAQRGGIREGRLCRGGWCRFCSGLPRLGSGHPVPVYR